MDSFSASLKLSTNQTISLCKDLLKSNVLQNESFREGAKATLEKLCFQFIKYKNCTQPNQMIFYLQEIANSISFCLLQDEDPSSFLVTVAGNVLVVDLTIPKGTAKNTEINTKISFAQPQSESQFLCAFEERICFLLAKGDFYELQTLFTVLKQLDSGSLPLLSQVYFELFRAKELEFFPQFHWNAFIPEKYINLLVEQLGFFEIWQGIFPVIYFYTSTMSLFQAECIPLSDEFVNCDCFFAAKMTFHAVKLTWQEGNTRLNLAFEPPIPFNSGFFGEFPLLEGQFTSELKLESIKLDSIDALMPFLWKLKLFLISIEIAPNAEALKAFNQFDCSHERRNFSLQVNSPSEIRIVELQEEGNLSIFKKEASIAASTSRCMKIISSYL